MTKKATNDLSKYDQTILIPKSAKFSQQDLNALTKMSPQEAGDFPTGARYCDICGQPIAGTKNSTKEEFVKEMKVGRHFICHNKQVQKNPKVPDNTPKWDDPTLSEDERAELYNKASDEAVLPMGEQNTNVSTTAPKFYVPPKGSIPLDKIVKDGGLSASDPKNLPAMDSLPDDVEELKNISAQADEDMRRLYEQGDPGLKEQALDELTFPNDTNS